MLGGILKQSEEIITSSVPDAAPVSDSSAYSSDDSDLFSRTHRRLDLPVPLKTVPSEVGGEEFREKCVDKKHRVTFGELEVRKYGIILGDNPCCEMGPPITIDWAPFKSKSVPIEDYESTRGPRRTKDELQMGWIQRKQVLRKLDGATDEEMREAACQAQRIRDQRNRTLKLLPYEFLQLPVESIQRKLRRVFGRKNT